MDDAGREKSPYQACYPAEEGLDSLHLGMLTLQPRGHSHKWVRRALLMSELLYPNTHSISKDSHEDRGAVHARLQALPPVGQRCQPQPWQLASKRERLSSPQ